MTRSDQLEFQDRIDLWSIFNWVRSLVGVTGNQEYASQNPLLSGETLKDQSYYMKVREDLRVIAYEVTGVPWAKTSDDELLLCIETVEEFRRWLSLQADITPESPPAVGLQKSKAWFARSARLLHFVIDIAYTNYQSDYSEVEANV